MLCSRVPFALLLLVALIFFRPARADAFTDLLNNRSEAVREIAVALARIMPTESWCKVAEDCNDGDCLSHGCSGGSFGTNFQCSNEVQILDQPKICKDFDNANGILLNYDRPFLWMPPGSATTKGDGNDIVIESLELRRDVCALKKINDNIVAAHKKSGTKAWLYATTTNGAFSTYPGHAIDRPENKFDQCGFTPNTRKWYISAASGTKDIVFLLDTTSLLTGSTKLFEALNANIDALDTRDFFSIVALGSENSVSVLGDSDGLQRATRGVKDSLRRELGKLQPSGGFPNVSAAFEQAFNVLESGETSGSSSKCSKLIVLLSGQMDGCSAECARTAECTCVEQLRNGIKKRQKELTDRGSQTASIVTFTEGNSNEVERMARTIACDRDNAGIWRRVSDDDTERTAMSTYSQIVAASLLAEDAQVFSSDIYEDFGGLGEVFTLAVAVYSKNEQRLVGVAGADLTVQEAIDVVGNEQDARDAIVEKSNESRECSRYSARSSCELQALRSQENSAICADALPGSGSGSGGGVSAEAVKCFKFGSSTYLKLDSSLSWGDSSDACVALNGSKLARVDTEAKNKVVSGIADADGSWIGIQALKGEKLMWEGGDELAYQEFGFNGEEVSQNVQNEANGPTCVAVDRRGVNSNWNIESCNVVRRAICELSAEAILEQCGEEGALFDVERPPAWYIPVNDVNCQVADASRSCGEDEEAIKNARPICQESNSEYSQQDRFCCGGKADQKRNEGGNGGDGDGLSGGLIAVIVVGALAVVVLLLGAYFGLKRYGAAKKGENDGKGEDLVTGDAGKAAERVVMEGGAWGGNRASENNDFASAHDVSNVATSDIGGRASSDIEDYY